MQRSWWWLPGVAGILWLLQWGRNVLAPFAELTLSFDGDVALHLLLGELMLDKGGLLETEPTNYLMDGAPFIAHEWLAEIVLALSYRAFDLSGPILLTAFVVATLSVGMFRDALRRGAGVWPAILAVVSAVTIQNTHLHPRPHILTWAFAFVFVVWCERRRLGELTEAGWFARCLALVVLWAQMHGGFLIIAPLLLAYAVGAALESLDADAAPGRLRTAAGFAVGGVVLIAATGLNPWGFALHAHFLAWLGNDYMTSFTTEFQSPDFRGLAGMFLLGFVVLLILGHALARTRPPATHLLLSLGLLAMALWSARHGAIFATVAAPLVAERLQAGLDALAAEHGLVGRLAAGINASSQRLGEAEARRGGWGLIGLLAAASVIAVGVLRMPPIGFSPALQPVEAVDWIEAHEDELEGRMFNPFRWGAYLAWRLYPEHQVFLNSWHDHLGEDALRTYFEVHDVKPDWEKVLRKHEVGWVIYATGSELALALDDDSSWERLHRDGTATVWRRK